MSVTETHPQHLSLRRDHADVIHYDGVLRIERHPSATGYVLSGEIDAATYDALAAALKDLGTGEVHLDLTALRFCDASGFGTMIGLTDHADRVVLHGVPAVLRRLLSITGWDTIPNLVVHPRTDPPGRRRQALALDGGVSVQRVPDVEGVVAGGERLGELDELDVEVL